MAPTQLRVPRPRTAVLTLLALLLALMAIGLIDAVRSGFRPDATPALNVEKARQKEGALAERKAKQDRLVTEFDTTVAATEAALIDLGDVELTETVTLSRLRRILKSEGVREPVYGVANEQHVSWFKPDETAFRSLYGLLSDDEFSRQMRRTGPRVQVSVLTNKGHEDQVIDVTVRPPFRGRLKGIRLTDSPETIRVRYPPARGAVPSEVRQIAGSWNMHWLYKDGRLESLTLHDDSYVLSR